MKKILLFLLPFFALAQNPTNFPYGIKNTVGSTNSTPTYVVTQETDGVHRKTTSTYFAKTAELLKKQFLSTGLIKNGLISINADNTKYNITAGIGVISNFDDPENPISTIVNFPAVTAKTPTYLTTGNITYVAINASGAVVEQATPFTTIQRRDLILLGAVIHSNLTNINVVNNLSAPTNADTNQLHDFMEAIGALNLTGNKYSANGANMSLDKSAGTIFKFGVNFANDWKKPHEINQSAGTAITFRYRTQNGTEGSDVTVLNPAVYDVSNVLTSVPSNKFSIQTVTIFQTGLTRIQYGQEVYNTLDEAAAAIFTRNYNVESNIQLNGITRAYIILKNSTTSLQNTSDAKIIEAQKFGGAASGGVALTYAGIVSALGYTPENQANKSDSYTVSSSTTYASTKAVVDGLATKQNTLTNPIAGTGTTNYIPKFTASGTLGNSDLSSTGSNLKSSSQDLTLESAGIWNPIKLIVGEAGAGVKIMGTSVSSGNSILKFDDTAGHIYSMGILNGTFSLPDNIKISGSGANPSLIVSAPDLWGSDFISFKTGTYGGAYNTVVASIKNTGGAFFNGRSTFGTPTDDGVNTLQVNGSTKTTALTLSTTPTTSASTYDILTRNTSTGVVEKAPQSYIYVAMSGQSNAVGYTLGTGGDFTVNNSVEVWNTSTNAWEVATSSNTHDVLQNGSPSTSNNLGWQFCKLIQKQTGKKVRYVLSALGGTSITEWENTTASQYVKLKTAIVNSAIPKIDYFLWHQGEADVAMSATTFETKLKAFYTAIKAETFFGKNTIILNGQLKKTGGQGLQNVTYSKIEKEASNDIRLVSSTNLVGWDLAHFTGAELDVFAQRYFNAAMGSDRTIYETIADSFVPMNSTLGFDLVGTGRAGLFQNGNLFEFGNSSILNEKYLTIGRNSLSTNPVEMQGFNAGVGYDSLTLQPLGSELLIGTRTNNFTDKVQVNGSILATTFKGGAALTGTPTAPTATVGTNTTQIATTAFVLANATGASLSANNTFTGQNTFSDYTTLGAPITLKSYTVATLPEGNAGDIAYVTDATSPTYLGTLTGGGSVVCPVFYNGTAWVSH